MLAPHAYGFGLDVMMRLRWIGFAMRTQTLVLEVCAASAEVVLVVCVCMFREVFLWKVRDSWGWIVVECTVKGRLMITRVNGTAYYVSCSS